jgi:probable HAF family extracellular repeat protein
MVFVLSALICFADSGAAYSGGTMIDLTPGLQWYSSWASGINNNGQIVGWSRSSGSYYPHAFLYSDGKMTDLGTLGGGLQPGLWYQ